MNLAINSASDTAFAAVPRFVRTVYDMLQNEDQRILSWSADGSHFQVYDVPRLENEVLRKYFKHSKFSSFQRQLNNFGFHKWTKTRASVATFSHAILVRCHPSQLGVLVSQMKLKQKTVTTTTVTTMVTSMKRPRSLLGFTTNHCATLAKKHKMAPRDVSDADELPDVSFASIITPLWLQEDDISSNNGDLLLLNVFDSVELETLEWDELSNTYDDSDRTCISVNDVLDFCFELDSTTDMLTEADVSAILGGVDATQVLSDCELDVLIGDVSDINTDVDTLLFV